MIYMHWIYWPRIAFMRQICLGREQRFVKLKKFSYLCVNALNNHIDERRLHPHRSG